MLILYSFYLMILALQFIIIPNFATNFPVIFPIGVSDNFFYIAPDSARSSLSTLIQCEVAVFALVISSSLISLPIIASLFSPVVVQIFKESNISDTCESFRNWVICSLDTEAYSSIRKRDYKLLQNILEFGKFPLLANPDFLELPHNVLLLYDKGIENNTIYMVRKKHLEIDMLKIDMDYIHFVLINIYRSFRLGNIRKLNLENCSILSLVEKILPYNQELRLHKYDIVSTIYNILKFSE